ncbi:MAG: hypothetical protein D6718_09920 [Acidobacteria bacterium]|nr:MAG: hypothetical protein D6718_09920 [Acidobacteriota bacterium]
MAMNPKTFWRWLGTVGVSVAASAAIAGGGPQVTFRPAAAGGEDRLEIRVPPVRWLSDRGAVWAEIEGFGRISEPGAPDLPLRRERVALPPGGALAVRRVEIDWYEGRLPGPIAAYPARDPDRPPVADRFLAGGYWPAEPVRVASQSGAVRNLRFATLEILPVQVDPAAGRFRVARRIVVWLDRGAAAAALPAPPRRPRTLSAAAEGILGAGTVEPNRAPAPAPAPEAAGAPNRPAFMFEVDRDGLYRIDYAWAQANGDTDGDGTNELLSFLTGHDPATYRMTCQGVEVPIRVEGEQDGRFDPGDAIVFYGQKVGDVDLFDPDVWQHGDYTDVNVYRLDSAAAPARIADEPTARAPQSGYPVPASFAETAHHEEDKKFQGFVPADGVDHWYVDPFVVSPRCVDLSVDTCSDPIDNGICGATCGDQPNEQCCAVSVDQFVATPGHAGGPVSVRVRLLGIKGYDFHRSDVDVDGTNRDRADWDGFVEFTHGVDQGPITFTPPGALGATTRVTVRLPMGRSDTGGQPVTRDAVAINWVEIDYDRLFQADGDRLIFAVDDANQEIHLDGFSALPEVWDVTRSTTSPAGMAIATPRRVSGVTALGSQFAFEFDDDPAITGKRHFVAAGPGGYLTPRGVREDLPPSALDASLGDSLKAAGNGADWLVIAYRPLLDTSPGSQLNRLVSHRQAQGLTTALVDIDDVYDEFSYGIADPQAVRDFIAYTLGRDPATGLCGAPNWSPAPRYVLLVGDGSWDHKNNYGFQPPRQLVPTQMYDKTSDSQFGHYPSDVWFAAVCGTDELPDATIGRLPAHTLAEAEEIFRKIVDYENAAHPPSWAARALLVSESDKSVNDEFYRVHDDIYDTWFTGSAGPQTATKIYEQDPAVYGCTGAADDENARIDSNVNAGAALISFAGHGSFKDWGKTCSFFSTDHPGPDDLDDFLPGTPLLFTVQANCVTGNFAATSSPSSTNDSWYSFVEDWLTTPDKALVGGMAPSHLSYTFDLDIILQKFYDEVFGKRKRRIVAEIDDAMRANFDTSNKTVLIRSFVLESDPALRLAVPAPPAPEILSIDQNGSHSLLITWTSVPEAASYRLFRSTNPYGGYTQVTETTATSYADTGLTNCQEYYYYVVSVDADGFESAWSNYNEDCDGARQDCKAGTPEDPNPPPAPVLLAVNDTERGGQLEAIWERITDPNVDVVSYTVEWRRDDEPAFAHSKTVGPAFDRTKIGGLDDGFLYHVRVYASHCTLDGPPSNELTGVPHTVKGIDPPRSIQDLQVFREPDPADGIADTRLTWTLPSQTVWGTDTTLQSIEVHGSTSGPKFPVDATTLLASLPETATEWIHENQGAPDQPSPGAPNWWYVVVAVDTKGQASAGGVELPGPVDDLIVQRLDATQELELSWSPVTTTMTVSGQSWPLWIAGYNLYGRNSILPRRDTGPANLLQADIPQSNRTITTRVPLPGDAIFTYQVLAEDVHGTESVW